jgi:sugar lactone lactonase YvrE
MKTMKMHAQRAMMLAGFAAFLLSAGAWLTPAYAAPGDIATVAGGYIGDNGPSTQARINNPGHIAIDERDGKTYLYIVDTYNERIRKVELSSSGTGTITTVAGNGTSAFTGDTGLATAASINEANGVAVDAAGNIYIADSFNQRIRKVNAADGKINTIAGSGDIGIGSHSGDSGPAVDATLYYPYSVATSSSGVVYIADTNNHRIRRIDTGGTIYTLAGSSTATFGGDGGQSYDAYLNYPADVAVDTEGNIYIADTFNHRIRKINASDGIINTVAGNGTAGYDASQDGGPATAASLNTPFGVAVDAAGNIFIADTYNNRVRKVDALTGNISTVAGTGLYDYSGNGGPATGAGLRYPLGVALDSAGNLYISDQFNDCIRKVNASDQTISTIAGGPLDAFYGDNGPAAAASLNYAHGVGVDSSGNVYVADTKNNRIRKVALSTSGTGTITTVAGSGDPYYDASQDGGPATAANINNPYAVTADSAGNIYISDTYNHRIRRVAAGTGIISTIAGNGNPSWTGDGPDATQVGLNGPRGLALDAAGSLYFADTENQRVRKVDKLGTISTIAGSGTATFSGDNGPATSAGLNTPTGVAVPTQGITASGWCRQHPVPSRPLPAPGSMAIPTEAATRSRPSLQRPTALPSMPPEPSTSRISTTARSERSREGSSVPWPATASLAFPSACSSGLPGTAALRVWQAVRSCSIPTASQWTLQGTCISPM